MNCCSHCSAIETFFDTRVAERDLSRYHRKGPDRSTRRLLKAVTAAGIANASVLDVGAGVGMVAHELLASGAGRATLVDASAPYVAAARAEAERRGFTDRVTIHHGDLVALAEELPEADVVTLHRVICCYPDMDRLVGASAGRARRLYAAVYPRDSWWVRLVVTAENGIRREGSRTQA